MKKQPQKRYSLYGISIIILFLFNLGKEIWRNSNSNLNHTKYKKLII